MTLLRLVCVAPLLLAALFAEGGSGDSKKNEKIWALREAILQAQVGESDNSETASEAYKELFTYLGRDGVKKLTNDEETSIALQAAWETLKKTVKRNPPIRGRTDFVFDKKSTQEFLEFFSKRVKADPPDWWRAALVKGDVFPEGHHAFMDLGEELPMRPKVDVKKDEVIITAGKQSVKISVTAYDEVANEVATLGTAPVALWGEEQSFVARPGFRAYPFNVVSANSKTGKKVWMTSVWAARRGFSSGEAEGYPIEIRRERDTVIVYGCECHGAYAEGFDAKTGKCQFRFCTCYWFNFSEAWGLK